MHHLNKKRLVKVLYFVQVVFLYIILCYKFKTFYSGICWLKQCNVPNPQIKSIATNSNYFSIRKTFCKIFNAILSLLSLKVGTKTQLFKIKKLA